MNLRDVSLVGLVCGAALVACGSNSTASSSAAPVASAGAVASVACVDGFATVAPALIEYQKQIGMGYWRG
jgi:hypothetical protein